MSAIRRFRIAELARNYQARWPGFRGLDPRGKPTRSPKCGAKSGTELFRGQKLIAVPCNVGPATMQNYEDLARKGFTAIFDRHQVFAGQREETFYIDLGAVFDTAQPAPLPAVFDAAEDGNDSRDPFGINRFSGTNVNSIVIEVPITRITQDGNSAEQTAAAVIGMYASTAKQKIKQFKFDGTTNLAGALGSGVALGESAGE